MQSFFNCWTRKEALVKAWGDGLSHPLHTFDVSLAPGEPARLLRLGQRSRAQCGWHLESFVPATGFVAAVAVAGAHGSVHIEGLDCGAATDGAPTTATHAAALKPPCSLGTCS